MFFVYILKIISSKLPQKYKGGGRYFKLGVLNFHDQSMMCGAHAPSMCSMLLLGGLGASPRKILKNRYLKVGILAKKIQ